MKPADVYIIGSNSAFGSRVVASEEVDQAFGMPLGKLKKRAGIHSLAYAGEHENESTLGAHAASQLMELAGEEAKNIDWIVAASETYHVYPSLSAVLHGILRLREDCSALDVGAVAWRWCRRLRWRSPSWRPGAGKRCWW